MFQRVFTTLLFLSTLFVLFTSCNGKNISDSRSEPVMVETPPSVTDEKIPLMSHVTIIVAVDSDELKTKPKNEVEGKVFLRIDGKSGPSTDSIRKSLLNEAVAIYNGQNQSGKIMLTPKQIDNFADVNIFGVPFSELSDFIDMSPRERDILLNDLKNPRAGLSTNDDMNDKEKLSDLKIWLQALINLGENNDEIKNLINKGESISIKADKETPFEVINKVFDIMQEMKLNKFTLMTYIKADD